MGIPAERIERLHELAREAAAEGDVDRGREYVRLARRIAERHRSGLPRRFRRFTCDECDAYLRPGATARVRLQSGGQSPGHVVLRCLCCGATKRYPYEET